MRFSTIIVACSTAATALALPSLPALVPAAAKDIKDCHCEVAKVSQPANALPTPGSGLKLALIAIGRGTQNYTCPTTSDPSAAPAAVGALANLFDFSCIATRTTRDQLGNITAGFETLPRNDIIISAYPATAKHYFANTTTPTFAFNNALGTVMSKKLNATAAPASAKNAVPWLKLAALAGQQSPVKEIYRLQTANGAAPATCANTTGPFQVEYAATYWFYVPTSFSW